MEATKPCPHCGLADNKDHATVERCIVSLSERLTMLRAKQATDERRERKTRGSETDGST